MVVCRVLINIYCSFDAAKMLSGEDVEFESGDYEGITTKGNEMEDFSHGSES